ncbi:hypothetical protein LSUB1_G005571 [Lachnellula subtilissima]|uniref:Small acidic protein n=1 Tax=Lachnellula subtilissima TaxID=602034 RepID=A0A8H8RJI1_9HELO|nr:hypothetical protein LSUB1_G005571 [Lachnellula subtilissima]
MNIVSEEDIAKRVKKEQHRVKLDLKRKLERREERRQEKIAKASKKRKGGSFSHGDSKRAKTEESNGQTNGAEQWNPDALSGDAARKDKFLRLLGAGKSNGAGSSNKVSADVDLEKVQNDLERQFDAGVRMKHEQGGKRRGLGA